VYGFVVFETGNDKNPFHTSIELVRNHIVANAQASSRASESDCAFVYVNPEIDQFWISRLRNYDPAGDSKTKMDQHAGNALLNCTIKKNLGLFGLFLMDT